MSRLFTFALMFGWLTGSASAQVIGGVVGGVGSPVPGRQAPPRDANAPAATGTAIIRGRVTAGDTGQPLRRAQVRISSPMVREGRVTVTDAQGRYEFRNLSASRYMVMASKGSYVTISYGQTRPNEPGRPLELGDGQLLERVDLALPRGSVITGRVLDEYGEPVANVQVAPMRIIWQQGQRRPLPVGQMSTSNDIGEFRLFGLAPGDYYISASIRETMMNDVSEDRAGYAPTYYPSTPNIAEAQAITLIVGQTAADVVLSLSPARTARLSGTVVDAQGRPARGGNIMLMPRGNGVIMTGGGGPIRPDGTFTLNSVPPGEYTLRAMPTPSILSTSSDAPPERPTPGSLSVSVNGEDVTGLVVAPPRMVTLSGRVVVPAGMSGLKPEMVRVVAMPHTPEPMFVTGPPDPLAEDFSFKLRTAPGSLVIRANVIVPNEFWAVRRVRVNGMDVTERPVDFAPGQDVEDIEIELTNNPPDVSGTVTDARGNPVLAYTALLFSRDSTQWFIGRSVATGRADQEGRFSVRSLRPGDYYAVALETVDGSELGNPGFLEAQIPDATRFSIGDGESRVLSLKLSPQR